MKTILKIYTRVIVLLFPFFFLPIVYDGFGLGKNAFLVLSGIIGLILWLIDVLVNKRDVVVFNKFWGWLLLLGIWAAVTFLKLEPGAEMRAMVGGTGFGLILGLLIWSFLWMQIADREEYKKQLAFLSISGVVVGIVSLLTFMVPNSKLPLIWPKDSQLVSIGQGWSVTGSILGEMILFVFLVWEWTKRLLKKLKDKVAFGEYLREAMSVVFFGLLLFLNIYKTIKLGWGYLDNKTAWMIAVEVLKNSPIFGVGLSGFGEAFLRFRPTSFNMTKFWAMTFDKSSMGILQIWTEMGVVGLALIFWGIGSWFKQRVSPAGAGFRSAQKYFWELGVLGLMILFLPLNTISIFLLVWLAANKLESSEKKMVLRVGENGLNVMPYLVTVVLLAGMGLVGFNLVKIVAGDFYWKKSLLAATKNEGVKTYELQIKAIEKNPTMADYRMIYSQTNLALVSNFLTKKDMTDEEKERASALVQQSVREAKAAIALNGKIADYWQNLAVIYKNLVGVVEGTADWSAQSYQQAISLNPANVSIYMDLGGLYYAAGDYESADRFFEKSVVNKNDYANAWYNWAYSAKQSGKLQMAINRMDQALKLVAADSEDYQKANEELTGWKKELEEVTKKQTDAAKTVTDDKEGQDLAPPVISPSPTQTQTQAQ